MVMAMLDAGSSFRKKSGMVVSATEFQDSLLTHQMNLRYNGAFVNLFCNWVAAPAQNWSDAPIFGDVRQGKVAMGVL